MVEGEKLVEVVDEGSFGEAVFAGFGGEICLEIDLGEKPEFGGDAVEGAGEVE